MERVLKARLVKGRGYQNVSVDGPFYLDIWDAKEAVIYGATLDDKDFSLLMAGYQVIVSNGNERDLFKIRLVADRPKSEFEKEGWILSIVTNRVSLKLNLTHFEFVRLISEQVAELK